MEQFFLLDMAMTESVAIYIQWFKVDSSATSISEMVFQQSLEYTQKCKDFLSLNMFFKTKLCSQTVSLL